MIIGIVNNGKKKGGLMEVNMIREMTNFQGIPYCDEKMTFFYDETGNCGKFSLSESGVNDPTALNNDFILGGVSFIGDTCPADLDKLISDLRLQSNELKFKNLYKSGYFISFMKSRRATVYIDWLYNSGLYIHYATINNLYYSLVDMVDSLWETQPQFAFSFEWVIQLKSALYNFCKEHLAETLNLLYKYHYPNIDKDNTVEFSRDFCNLIQTYNDESTEQGFWVECFRQMLKNAGRHGELVFLHDNESNILVEEYYTLYQSRCYTYKYSLHHFDFEKVILAKMQASPMTDNGQPFVNYDFLDSKQNKMIQVSDVFVGLMAKMFQFLDAISIEAIATLKTEENTVALVNFSKINELINRSDSYHPMMIQNVNDIDLTRQRMFKLQSLAKAVNL